MNGEVKVKGLLPRKVGSYVVLGSGSRRTDQEAER